MILLHDIPRPYVAKPVQTYLGTLKWKILLIHHIPQILHLPIIIFSVRWLSSSLAQKQFHSKDDLKNYFILGKHHKMGSLTIMVFALFKNF